MMGQSPAYVAYRALTCPLRVMPDFLVIGVHRGGTSAFYYHLTEHPSVAAATTKELNFFDKNYHKGPWWYRAHFPTVAQKRHAQSLHQGAAVTGEASPYYMFHPLAPQRVAKTLPNAKLIALLRNPIERAYSQYRRYRQLGRETLPLEEAIAREERSLNNGESDVLGYSSYLARGLYAEQLERWLALFPREQLLILRSEDFYADPATELKRALLFLGVAPEALPHKSSYARFDGYSGRPQVNNGSGMSGMDPAIRERLQAFYAPHNARLQALLGRDFAWE